MITRVDTVLIGKTCPASYTNVDALSAGDVALFDENRNIITTEAAAADASAVYVGICKGTVAVTLPDNTTANKPVVEYSNKLTNNELSYVLGGYSAPVQDSIAIDMTNADITIGHRYVLRVVYKDIYEAPGQFTHTYEVIATSETPATLAAAFLAKINKHANRRISAALVGNVLTLTSLVKDDSNELNSITEYSTVSMEVSLYVTVPGALLSNIPVSVAGVTITKTQGNPGKGYWKQVRDLEVRNMGYKGHVFTGAYPEVKADLMTEKDATYDYMTIESSNKYLSPDNQYVKAAPVMVSLFVKSAASLSTSQFAKEVKAFIGGFDTAQNAAIKAITDAAITVHAGA